VEHVEVRAGRHRIEPAIPNPDEREQMLYYVPFTDAIRYLRPFPAMFTAQLGVFERASKIPAEQRSAEDWLIIAEAGAEIATPAERLDALKRADSLSLTLAQHARVLLVDGLMAAQDDHWDVALRQLSAALPVLDERRRELAEAAMRLASIASGSATGETQPDEPTTAAGLLGRAYLAAYEGDLDLALDIVRKGESLYPDNADFADLQGSIGLLRGDRALLVDAMHRGTAAEPNHPGILLLSAHVKSEYFGDYEAAIRDAQRAVALVPGNSLAWDILGSVQARAGLRHAAALSFKRGLAADPNDATLRDNYAVLLLDWNRIEEAKKQLDRALGADPEQTLTHLYRGRALIQESKFDAALEELLASSTANPTDAQTLLLLGYTYYRLGDTQAAMQQLDLAERYDPHSPYPDALRSLLLGEDRDAGGSVRSSRSAVKRNEALAGTRLPGTAAEFPDQLFANSLRDVGLGEWSRFLAERSFDPFDATSYFERAANERPSPYVADRGSLERVSSADMAFFRDPPIVPQVVSPAA
ncbi:MAG TPA: tetratricopeptide repeat protein, partial [Sphingomicrobium sp.]|nr:tetratricopeptide repeat protein [Sphingomicrobium sp.]